MPKCFKIKDARISFSLFLVFGIKSLKHECALYKARGFKYLYLGGADEYKKQIDGFEILGPA